MCFPCHASWTLFLSPLCPYIWGFPFLQQGKKTPNIFRRKRSCCIIPHCLFELGSFLSTWDAYAQIWGEAQGYEFLVLWFMSGTKRCQSEVWIASAWRVAGGRREDLFYMQIHVNLSCAVSKLRKRQDTSWENSWVMEGEGSWLPWAGTIRWYQACSSGKGSGKEEKRGLVGFDNKSAKKRQPGKKGEFDSFRWGAKYCSRTGSPSESMCPRSWHSLFETEFRLWAWNQLSGER